MKLNLVHSFEDLINPGDAIESFNSQKNITQLVIACPGCGKISGSAGGHVFNKETLSYTPSIVHDKNLGGCGWHGWLTNGEFKEC